MSEAVPNMTDPATQHAVTQIEINAIKEDVRGVVREVHGLRDTMATKSDFLSLQSAIREEASKRGPMWPLYSLMMTGVLAIGALAYWPIRESQNDLKDTVRTLATSVVYSRRFDAQVGAIERTVNDIRQTYITQREFDRMLKLFDDHISKAVERAELQAIVTDRDSRIGGTVRRLERLEEQQIRR